MSETEQGATVVELLLREPEIVAWLDERRPRPSEDARTAGEDDEPPRAA
jgi:hypothetical protein